MPASKSASQIRSPMENQLDRSRNCYQNLPLQFQQLLSSAPQMVWLFSVTYAFTSGSSKILSVMSVSLYFDVPVQACRSRRRPGRVCRALDHSILLFAQPAPPPPSGVIDDNCLVESRVAVPAYDNIHIWNTGKQRFCRHAAVRNNDDLIHSRFLSFSTSAATGCNQ